MPIWDGGDISQPFWEREALQLAWEQQEEPDEIDLAPGTEAPPGTTVPHERSMRAIIDSRNAARKLWDLIQKSLRGAGRMISLRLACLFCLTLASQACGQEPGAVTRARAEHGRCSVSSCQPESLRNSWRNKGDLEHGHRHAGMRSEVRCVNGEPVTDSLPPTLTGLARAETIRHEAEHRAQFAVGCDSVAHAWETDPALRLALETQATCRGLDAYADPLQRRMRKGEAAAVLTQLYLPAFDYEDVMAALDVWCGG